MCGGGREREGVQRETPGVFLTIAAPEVASPFDLSTLENSFFPLPSTLPSTTGRCEWVSGCWVHVIIYRISSSASSFKLTVTTVPSLSLFTADRKPPVLPTLIRTLLVSLIHLDSIFFLPEALTFMCADSASLG